MMNYKIIKLKYGVVNLSEAITENIVNYCLGQMSNNELDYTKWQIGTSSKLEIFNEGQGKCWECQTEIEAKDTKKYFIEDKIMADADGVKINGKYIYVKRLAD
jgi:hypothetical protein